MFRAAAAGAEARRRRRAQYLWVDSAENQERFKEEYEKVNALSSAARRAERRAVASSGVAALSRRPRPPQVLSFVASHRDFLNSDKADQNGA